MTSYQNGTAQIPGWNDCPDTVLNRSQTSLAARDPGLANDALRARAGVPPGQAGKGNRKRGEPDFCRRHGRPEPARRPETAGTEHIGVHDGQAKQQLVRLAQEGAGACQNMSRSWAFDELAGMQAIRHGEEVADEFSGPGYWSCSHGFV
ncbi:hypothetical protein KL951_003247 [Ogataea haglerorum]|nr:hypothetical protein KL951_003247 [Ogataea haglerorum]KAG7802038.1 hypothetical protein KL944_002415 [Ogataea haglerorum]